MCAPMPSPCLIPRSPPPRLPLVFRPANHRLTTTNHVDVDAEIAKADIYKRQSGKVFCLALLILAGTHLMNGLAGGSGLPILMYVLGGGVIPIAILFTGCMLYMCSGFVKEEVKERVRALPV